MARARNVKPGFFTNDLLAEVDPLGRLLFIGLWCLADRDGRLEDRPKRIKAEILPYDDVDVEALLHDLGSRGFIQRYEVNGQRFIQVLNFAKHQNPHVNEKPSSIPAPEQHRAGNEGAPERHRANRADSLLLIPDSLSTNPKPSPADVDSQLGGFTEFWLSYPCKKAKAEALKAWKKLKPDDQAIEGILAGLERDKRSDQWLRDGGQFIPHPATWLNGRRWEDEAPVPVNGAECMPWEGAI